MKMQDRTEPGTEIDRLRDAIADARSRTEQGETLDLTPLSRDVDGLCEKLAALPAAAARPLASRLATLMADLDVLESALRTVQAEAGKRLEAMAPFSLGDR